MKLRLKSLPEQVLVSGRDNLFLALPYDGGERGRNWQGRVKESSVYTRAVLRPRTAALAVLGVGAGLLMGARRLRSLSSTR